MPTFAANLTTMFNEVEFMDRFEHAHNAGFTAVEYLFPYAFSADEIAAKLSAFSLQPVSYTHLTLPTICSV